MSRTPPPAGFYGVRRIADINDDIYVSTVARHPRSPMYIPATKISVPMSAGAARAELAEQLRVDGILQPPDQHTLVVRLSTVAPPAASTPPHARPPLSPFPPH